MGAHDAEPRRSPGGGACVAHTFAAHVRVRPRPSRTLRRTCGSVATGSGLRTAGVRLADWPGLRRGKGSGASRAGSSGAGSAAGGALSLAAVAGRPDRDRMAAVAAPERPGAWLGKRQGEILALADGRRTPRDLAFALGRGVCPTLLHLARLHDGLDTARLHRESRATVDSIAKLLP